jgi:hypothetical protein
MYPEGRINEKFILVDYTIANIFLFTGCLDFGEDEETTSPTKVQVSRCRSEMYLNLLMKITPLGFKLQGSGIDDAIWFKFKTEITDIHKIFINKVVDTSKFKKGFTFIYGNNKLDKIFVKWA